MLSYLSGTALKKTSQSGAEVKSKGRGQITGDQILAMSIASSVTLPFLIIKF